MKANKYNINKKDISDILKYRSMLNTVYKRRFTLEQAAAVWNDNHFKNIEE